MFTAYAAMILKNDGKLDYDTDIRTYLPDFPYEDVTCRLLMTHRAGLPRYLRLAHDKLKKKKVQFEQVTLHVGLGTFQPVKVEDIKKHKMHPEFVEDSKKTLQKLWQAKKDGKRIIAVGTTSVRVLETVMASLRNKNIPPTEPFKGWVNLFIYPGFEFKFTDAMITNFHLPQSTLLMLVSGFASRKYILNAYEEAKKKNYRFYSFGDAMFIY